MAAPTLAAPMYAPRARLYVESLRSEYITYGPGNISDMAEYFSRLFAMRADIDRLLDDLSRELGDAQLLSPAERNRVVQFAEELRRFFEKHGFKHAQRAAERIRQAHGITLADVKRRFDELWDDFVQADGKDRRIEIIDADKWKHYGAGFTEEVSRRFPQATEEMKEAGTCYALGRNTACVFHLMRAVEYGIRALAIAAGVPAQPKIPLEYQTWEDVLSRIEKAVDAPPFLNGWDKPARSAFNAFYKGSMADLRAFKDECRNLVMHTRSGLYNHHEAGNWILRVSQFFERLPAKLNEATSTTLLSETDWT
jgi:hypothetical protein